LKSRISITAEFILRHESSSKTCLKGSTFPSPALNIRLWTCWGVAPNPTYFFALMQKSMQKKSRLHLIIDPIAACSLKDK
jgi:hypothetical protein